MFSKMQTVLFVLLGLLCFLTVAADSARPWFKEPANLTVEECISLYATLKFKPSTDGEVRLAEVKFAPAPEPEKSFLFASFYWFDVQTTDASFKTEAALSAKFMETAFISFVLDPAIKSRWPVSELNPKLLLRFNRISNMKTVAVHLDGQLCFDEKSIAAAKELAKSRGISWQ